jgi:hypothetical protein
MGDTISPRWTRTTTTRALSTRPCTTAGLAAAVFDFRADFCHSAPFETHASDLMFRANARRAKGDFLSVVQQLKWLQRLFVSRPKQSPGRRVSQSSRFETVGTSVRGMGGKNGITLEYAANNDLQYRQELLKHCKLSSPLATMSIGPRGCAIILKSSFSASKLGFLRREHVLLADS